MFLLVLIPSCFLSPISTLLIHWQCTMYRANLPCCGMELKLELLSCALQLWRLWLPSVEQVRRGTRKIKSIIWICWGRFLQNCIMFLKIILHCILFFRSWHHYHLLHSSIAHMVNRVICWFSCVNKLGSKSLSASDT